MNHIVISALLTTAIALTACDTANTCNYNENDNTLSCPEKTYKTANINGQIWMAENLIRHDITGNSYCYGDVPSNCAHKGSLYPFEIASKICPDGWTLPTLADFEKANVTSATFDAKRVGFRYYDGKYADENISASFWTAESFDDARATMVRLDSNLSFEHFNKSIAVSVRCIKK